MEIKIYNTLNRKIEEFKPLKKKRASIYTCGPTVYNYAHIGNLRTYIFEDILERVLKYNGYKIKRVINITDVGHLTSDADEGDDKMEKGASREGKTAYEIAKFYTRAFKKDLKELNIIKPDIWCKATSHIKEQIALIKILEKNGFTYKTSDGIYFDTSKLKDYGKLANLQNQTLKAGARIEMGNKKNPTDFALWKFSPVNTKRQMEWKSPWGVGFPGWHVECSAMAKKYLGQPFDIHCGGIDHISVHHTNEIAQSEVAYGKPLANFWMHGEFLVITSGDKMSKSGNNFLTLKTLHNQNIDPLSYRYLLLQTHYRKQLTFSFEALQGAQKGLQRLYNEARTLKINKIKINQAKIAENKKIFLELINNDLDTPEALAFIWKALKDKQLDLNTLLDFDKIFGLKIKESLKIKPIAEEKIPKNVEEIALERAQARTAKDWKKSDECRLKLEELGYKIEDTAEGQKISKI